MARNILKPFTASATKLINMQKIRTQLTLLYSLGILITVFSLLSLFYLSTEIVFYRQVDDTLNTHLVALADNVAKNAAGAGCNCISRESAFLEGILEIPGMPTAILDLGHQTLKTSVDWAVPEKPLTEFIPGRYFNDRLAGLSYRFLMLPVTSDGKTLGFVVMGHPIDAFLKTRTTLAGVMIVIYLLIIFPAIALGKFLAEKALSKEKQFISDMAHSLKTPLAVLQSQLENSSEPDKSKLLANVKRISQTVSETLEIAYSETSQNKGTVDLTELLAELIEIGQHLGQKKNIKITKNTPTNPIIVSGTRQKLAKAILAVLENAINYSKNDGQIEIILKLEGNLAILAVEDYGSGISEDDLPYVFDRFFRGKQINKTKGSGLGLSISKNIIEELGGKISLKSEKRRGTTATISLPVRPAGGPAGRLSS